MKTIEQYEFAKDIQSEDDALAHRGLNSHPQSKEFEDAIESEYHRGFAKVKEPNKYLKKCKGVSIDIYDVLSAFNVTNPATAHAIKKLLMSGQRGYKDTQQDLQEAIDSIERAKELEI